MSSRRDRQELSDTFDYSQQQYVYPVGHPLLRRELRPQDKRQMAMKCPTFLYLASFWEGADPFSDGGVGATDDIEIPSLLNSAVRLARVCLSLFALSLAFDAVLFIEATPAVVRSVP